MKQELTCPQCSYKFALDQALNLEIALQVRTEFRDESKKKEAELRRQLPKEANDKAERNSVELQAKVEAQAKGDKRFRPALRNHYVGIKTGPELERAMD